jgi:hypothetical protein
VARTYSNVQLLHIDRLYFFVFFSLNALLIEWRRSVGHVEKNIWSSNPAAIWPKVFRNDSSGTIVGGIVVAANVVPLINRRVL